MTPNAQISEREQPRSEPAASPQEPKRPAGAAPQPTPARRAGDRSLLGSEPLENLDRLANATTAKLTMGMSPVGTAMSAFDWAAHLMASPGKQVQLCGRAADSIQRWTSFATRAAVDPDTPPCIEPERGDHRFDHAGWQRYPFNVISQAFLFTEDWWRAATSGIRGVSDRNARKAAFTARQILDMYAPSNMPVLNPEVIEVTAKENGANLMRGMGYFIDDATRRARGEAPSGTEAYRVGETVAVTPGKVVFRNHLMELIQYAPSTKTAQREPVLMQSAWMMKYYIMDLSPHNSLVKYLVDRGHTVFMISWRNPGTEDRDLGMEDYRKHGTMAAIDVISSILPDRKIHAVGYCLGGILLTLTAATMGRDGDDRLASITLFTTLVDFTDVGEMSVFMDTSEVTFMEDMMWHQGYLDSKQAGGSFQLLKSRDLIWSKMVREYLLGQREPMFDLMAWNADGTRMPYRQHSELLRHFYRDNELFQGTYVVEGRPIRISDIHVPIFSVAAERDHVAPWHSVYKIGLQSDATELTFALTSGGHNVGIVNEPGHPRRSFRLATWREGDRTPDAGTFYTQTEPRAGSWWPAWQEWLVAHSTGEASAVEPGTADKNYPPLCDAPGTYVLQK